MKYLAVGCLAKQITNKSNIGLYLNQTLIGETIIIIFSSKLNSLFKLEVRRNFIFEHINL
jgi:hypothetical protein